MYNQLVEKNNIRPFVINIPPTHIPNPTDEDYQNGFIQRYFIQRSNDKNSFVFEVNSYIAKEISNNPHWTQIEIKWRLTGPLDGLKNEKTGFIYDNGVYGDNVNSISKAKKHIPNINSYITNPLQFYKGKSL